MLKTVSNIVFNFSHAYRFNYYKAITVKLFSDIILLVKIYNFEGFLNQYKIDIMVQK